VTSENHGIILDRVGARVFVTSLPSFYRGTTHSDDKSVYAFLANSEQKGDKEPIFGRLLAGGRTNVKPQNALDSRV
jgi:hypothetical protein